MRSRAFVLSILVTGLLWGCYPGGAEYTEDYDIVLTNYNDDYDFTSKGTYALPDEIVKITGNLAEGDAPEFVPDIYADQILARVRTNMTNLGWTEVDISADPDLLFAPATWETTTIYYWYDYWGYWWGGYYPGWGWGYYPGYPTYSSYTTGTLLFTMLDPNEISGNGNPVSQWTGAVNGLMNGVYDPSRVNQSIDQIFAQSPYLKIN
jgi:hypothetical protein